MYSRFSLAYVVGRCALHMMHFSVVLGRSIARQTLSFSAMCAMQGCQIGFFEGRFQKSALFFINFVGVTKFV
jgi:hypothetical protein